MYCNTASDQIYKQALHEGIIEIWQMRDADKHIYMWSMPWWSIWVFLQRVRFAYLHQTETL
jgi:hypothetical protein